MKTACRHYMLRTDSLAATFDHAAELGWDGVELTAVEPARYDELRAAIRNSGVQVAITTPEAGQKAMHAEARERRAWMDSSRQALDLAAELGATGFVVVPTLPNKMSGQPRLPDLWPVMSQVEAEQKVFIAMLHELGEYAAERGVYVILEPLNRYEQFWPLQLAEGVALCQAADTRGAGILADFFHMNIEEADIAASMTAAMDWIVHVHIADSHRRQPGTGHTDFAPGLAALAAAGYDRYLGFEYSPVGDRDADMRAAQAHIAGLLAGVRKG